MIYIKILDNENVITSIEAIDIPVYVYKHPKNGKVLRCVQPLGQGIISSDGKSIYQLDGKDHIDRAVATAIIITEAEYLESLSTLNKDENADIEDTEPEISENIPEEKILTRAELTVKLLELEEQLAATKILLGVE